jgi:hypothetical protein
MSETWGVAVDEGTITTGLGFDEGTITTGLGFDEGTITTQDPTILWMLLVLYSFDSVKQEVPEAEIHRD